MTNKEHLSTLSSEDWYDSVYCLITKYSKQHTDSRLAIIDWLSQEYKSLKLIHGNMYSYCPFCYTPVSNSDRICSCCKSEFDIMEGI